MNTLIKLEDGTELSVTPHAEHEWTQTTEIVAQGYGVSATTIRRHLQNHSDELIEGQHYSRDQNMSAGNRSTINWTKLGVTTVGFFIRSKRAKEYRKAVAKLVIETHENKFAVVTTDNPQLDALQGLVDMMRAQDVKQKELDDKVSTLALREEERSGNLEWMTAAGYLNTVGEQADRSTCAKLGKATKKHMALMNLERGEMPDPRFGKVFTYHPIAIENAWNEMNNQLPTAN